MKRTTQGISRRAVMKTFAGLGVAAPFFKGLLGDALAQTAPTYPRFIVLYNPHGCAADLWRPRAPDGSTVTPFSIVRHWPRPS